MNYQINKLLITILLIFSVGCAGALPEPGMPDKPAPVAKKKTAVNGMSDEVAVLLGLGAVAMMVSMAGMTADATADHPEFAVITGGTGLLLWGAAGITHLAQDTDEDVKVIEPKPEPAPEPKAKPEPKPEPKVDEPAPEDWDWCGTEWEWEEDEDIYEDNDGEEEDN